VIDMLPALNAAVLTLALSLNAVDAKPAPTKFTTVGDIEGVLVKFNSVDQGGTVTIRIPEVALQRGKGGRHGGGAHLKATHKDLELTATPEVKIRILKLPPAKDENGHTRSRTADELRDLKGPTNLPGYTAQPSDLQADQVVRLRLVKPKDQHPPAETGKKKDNETDSKPTNYVSIITILANPATPAHAPANGDKKNK
jgi:hypothetical protein